LRVKASSCMHSCMTAQACASIGKTPMPHASVGDRTLDGDWTLIRELTSFIRTRGFTIARFLVSGCIAASVDFSLLFCLTHYLGIHYLLSSGLAFVAAASVGFTLQKFWTFRDASLSRVHRQAIQYLGLGVANLGINTAFMFILVDKLQLWYMFSQVIVCGILAVNNFFLYNICIFKTQGKADAGTSAAGQ